MMNPRDNSDIKKSEGEDNTDFPLSDEIILYIFSYLNVPDLLSLLETNKRFKQIASDGQLWQAKLQKDYPDQYEKLLKYKIEVTSWFQQYYMAYQKKHNTNKILTADEIIRLNKILADAKKVQSSDISQKFFDIFSMKSKDEKEKLQQEKTKEIEAAKNEQKGIETKLDAVKKLPKDKQLLFDLVEVANVEKLKALYKKGSFTYDDLLLENQHGSPLYLKAINQSQAMRDLIYEVMKSGMKNMLFAGKKSALSLQLIFAVITNQNEAEISDLVKQGAHLNVRDNIDFHIHPTILIRNREMLNLLIKVGFDVNSKGGIGWYSEPLIFDAIRQNNQPAIMTLIKANADVNIKIDKKTPLILAITEGNAATTLLLIKHGAKIKSLLDENIPFPNFIDKKVYNLIYNEIKKLFTEDDGTIDFNKTDSTGCTLLHWAAVYADETEIRDLVKMGADVDAEDTYRRTPFDLAVLSKNIKGTQCLLELGVDPNSILGEDNIHDIVDLNEPEILNLVFSKNANNKNLQIALLKLSQNTAQNPIDKQTQAEMAIILMQHGADPTYSYIDYSPINAAAENGNISLLKTFLTSAKVTDKHIEEAILYANRRYQTDTVKMLNETLLKFYISELQQKISTHEPDVSLFGSTKENPSKLLEAAQILLKAMQDPKNAAAAAKVAEHKEFLNTGKLKRFYDYYRTGKIPEAEGKPLFAKIK